MHPPESQALPLVKVFVSSYNRRELLRQSLDSALAQTYSNFHLVVVDDCSTDGAAELAQEYQRRHPERVTAVCKPERRGVGDSVNLGLDMCRDADYIGFLADDDLWAPTKLERQVDVFLAHPGTGLVFTDTVLIGHDGEPLGMTFADVAGPPELERPVAEILRRGLFICSPSVVTSRAALELVDFSFPRCYRFLNDKYMWLVIAAHLPIRYVDEPLTYYRRTHGSTTIVESDAIAREDFQIRAEAFRRFPAVVAAAGGPAAARRSSLVYALDRAAWCMRDGRYATWRWLGLRILASRSPWAISWFVYLSLARGAARGVERLQRGTAVT